MTDTAKSGPIQIRNRWTGAVQFESKTAKTVAETVAEAIKTGSNLRNSDLRGSNLRNSNLRNSDLRGSDLRGSNLSDSSLTGSDLSYSDLTGSDLSYSDLTGSDLSGSDLRGSDLRGSNLRDSDLRGSNLRGSNLRGSDLRGSNLRGSNLTGSNLRGSDLTGSDLSYSDLAGSDLSDSKGADLAIAQTRILPDGDLVAWKKATGSTGADVIIRLRIPADAKRSHAFGRKCRAEFADVLEIIGEGDGTAHSKHDPQFIYRAGDRVKPSGGFNTNWQSECESGIHFFITRLEAEVY